MTNRLPYETRAGQFSEAETFLQLQEHLRLAAEACYAIGHFRKENGDRLIGQGFLAYGQLIQYKILDVLTNLATGKMKH